MEAPKCQFCGKVEWRHVCSVGVAGRKIEVRTVPQMPKQERVVETSEGTPKIAVEAPVGKFDRKKYQREYMRKWRAKR